MQPITLATLRKVAPKTPVSAAPLCQFMDKYCPKYGIDTPRRIAMFLAQCAHETGQFNLLRELWNPTPQQKRYDPPSSLAKDLGNLHIGDGFRFRGRGLIQTTGRGNYSRVSKALGVDFVSNPALLETPEYAVMSACYYWKTNNLNGPADVQNVKRATLIINGGTNGLKERNEFYLRACDALGINRPAGAV